MVSKPRRLKKESETQKQPKSKDKRVFRVFTPFHIGKKKNKEVCMYPLIFATKEREEKTPTTSGIGHPRRGQERGRGLKVPE